MCGCIGFFDFSSEMLEGGNGIVRKYFEIDEFVVFFSCFVGR